MYLFVSSIVFCFTLTFTQFTKQKRNHGNVFGILSLLNIVQCFESFSVRFHFERLRWKQNKNWLFKLSQKISEHMPLRCCRCATRCLKWCERVCETERYKSTMLLWTHEKKGQKHQQCVVFFRPIVTKQTIKMNITGEFKNTRKERSAKNKNTIEVDLKSDYCVVKFLRTDNIWCAIHNHQLISSDWIDAHAWVVLTTSFLLFSLSLSLSLSSDFLRVLSH